MLKNQIQKDGFIQNINYNDTKKFFKHCLKTNQINIELKIKNENPNKTKLANCHIVGKLINYCDRHIVIEIHSIDDISCDRRELLFNTHKCIKVMFNYDLNNYKQSTCNNSYNDDYLTFCNDNDSINFNYHSDSNINKSIINNNQDDNYYINDFINIFDIELFKVK